MVLAEQNEQNPHEDLTPVQYGDQTLQPRRDCKMTYALGISVRSTSVSRFEELYIYLGKG